MKKLIIIYSFTIAISLSLSGCSNINETSTSKTSSELQSAENSYINNNSVPLDLDNLSQVDIPIFDSKVKDYELILAGEEHAVSIDSRLRLEFIKHLNTKADIKYYLGEIPYSVSVLLNQYLKNGNEEILKRIISSLKGSYDYSKDEFDFYKDLYLYNKTLSDSKKIILLGVDVEQSPNDAVWCLATLLPDKNIPVKLQPIIKELKDLNSQTKFTRDQMLKFSTTLKDNINSNRDLYQAFLGEDTLFDFEFVNQNIINKIDNGDSFEVRENRIFENFMKIYKHMPNGKYFGQFGLSHIPQRKMTDTNWDWFGTKLNYTDSPLKGKVLSIAYLYDKSYQRMPDSSVRNTSNYARNDLIDSVSKSNLTLIRLDGENSPFKKKLIWSITDVQTNQGVTTDYYQYYIIIRNSDAVSQYQDT